MIFLLLIIDRRTKIIILIVFTDFVSSIFKDKTNCGISYYYKRFICVCNTVHDSYFNHIFLNLYWYLFYMGKRRLKIAQSSRFETDINENVQSRLMTA